MRTFFITDIHGEYSKLIQLLANVNFDIDNDTLVLGGDYFDRGEENDKVAQWLIDNYKRDNIILLKGNHDLWLSTLLSRSSFDFMRGGHIYEYANMLTSNGGLSTLNQLSKLDLPENIQELLIIDNIDKIQKAIHREYPELLDVLRSMKCYHETDEYIFTHATLPDNYKNADVGTWQAALWGNSLEFANEYKGKQVFIGHCPVQLVNEHTSTFTLNDVTFCDGGMTFGYGGIIVEL